jgi:Zinc knuckle
MKEIPQWSLLVTAAEEEEEAEEQEAMAILLRKSGSASSSEATAPLKKKVMNTSKMSDSSEPEHQQQAMAAKKRVSEVLARVKRAYGYLYAALPADIRLLIADVPQGYAYGIWSFLEKRYRNTEQDSVAALWKEYIMMKQDEEESFDGYKARVDAALELLTHAKQDPPAGLYSTLMLWNLRVNYSTAVLTLKTSGRLSSASKIDWAYIVQFMNEFERNQRDLEGGPPFERVMSARSRSRHEDNKSEKETTTRQSSSHRRSEVRCFNCEQMGHYANECSQPKSNSKWRENQERSHQDKSNKKKKKKNRATDDSPSSSSSSSSCSDSDDRDTAISSDEEEEKKYDRPRRDRSVTGDRYFGKTSRRTGTPVPGPGGGGGTRNSRSTGRASMARGVTGATWKDLDDFERENGRSY